jgi:hypothetical protein
MAVYWLSAASWEVIIGRMHRYIPNITIIMRVQFSPLPHEKVFITQV